MNMRQIRFGLAGLVGLALVAPATAAQKTPAAIKAEITSQITTNGTRAITGAILNTILTDIADSYGDISCTQFPILSGAVTSPGTTCVTTPGAALSGLSVTRTVRSAGGASDCTLIFTGGLLTGGTCAP